MATKTHTIEVDKATAEALEARAAARGMSVSELLADLAGAGDALPADLQVLRDAGDGPWAPNVLAEDARRLADFHRTRMAVPWEDVKAWLETWGTPNEVPRRLSRASCENRCLPGCRCRPRSIAFISRRTAGRCHPGLYARDPTISLLRLSRTDGSR
jgi:Ribbon-helix-helix protein, copG family